LALRALAGAGAAVLGSNPALAATSQPVRTEAGLVQGISSYRLRQLPSIREFATRRADRRVALAATAAARCVSGVQKADRFGSICPQAQPPHTTLPLSEDCLFLNVWSGASSASERRPVFVWIYGGGFGGGSGSSPEFDGENLARKGLVGGDVQLPGGCVGLSGHPELE